MAYGVSSYVDEKWVEFCSNLPHGSGIDGDWTVYEPKNGKKVYFSNSYHIMNEVGFYTYWQDFSVVIDRVDWENDQYTEFDLQFNGGERYLTRVTDLRSYLEDTIYYALEMLENGT